MRKLVLPLVAALAFASASASEYVVLKPNNRTVAVQPSDIVQVVSIVVTGGQSVLQFSYADGSNPTNVSIGGVADGTVLEPKVLLTGVTQVFMAPGGGSANHTVTLRITKKAEEMASQPVLIPAVPDGRYDVSIETSTDAENWAPAAPGEYLGSSSHRFFRVKAIRKETPPPATGE